MQRWFLGAFVLLAAALAAVYVVNPLGTASTDPRARVLGFTLMRVSSSAMAPTLQPGQIIWVDTLALRRGHPPRGAVVVLRFPRDPTQVVVSRIVGLDGDRVAIVDGIVHVDGQPTAEPYLAGTPPSLARSLAMDEIAIPPDHFFVLGDHRDNSLDGRHWGPVHRRELVGVVPTSASADAAPP